MLSAVAVVVVAVVATACGSAGSSSSAGASGSSGSGSGASDGYKVSFVADLSGPGAPNGSPGVAGFTAAIDAINAAGGVNGKKIVLNSPIDSMSTTTGAQSAARAAIAQQPVAVVMNAASSGMAAAAPLLSQVKVTTLSLVTSDALLVPTPTSWYFTASPASDQVGKSWAGAAAQAIGGSLKGKKVALIHLNTPGTDGFAVAWRKYLVADGGTVVDEEQTTVTLASFTSQAAKIVSDGADVVLNEDLASSTSLEVSALANAGYKGVFLGGDTANDDVSMKKYSAILPNYIAVRDLASPVPGDVMSQAAQKYGFTSSLTSSYFPKGWALGYALAAGLKKCGASCAASDLPAAVQDAGAVDAGSGVAFGPLSFTSATHVIESSFQWWKWDASADKSVSAQPPVTIR